MTIKHAIIKLIKLFHYVPAKLKVHKPLSCPQMMYHLYLPPKNQILPKILFGEFICTNIKCIKQYIQPNIYNVCSPCQIMLVPIICRFVILYIIHHSTLHEVLQTKQELQFHNESYKNKQSVLTFYVLKVRFFFSSQLLWP